jgi:hypothetical protein
LGLFKPHVADNAKRNPNANRKLLKIQENEIQGDNEISIINEISLKMSGFSGGS